MTITNKSLSLRKNFSWTFAGNVVNAISLWGIVAVVAKLGNVEMVGKFELSRSIALPLLAITMLSLRSVQVTDARSEYSFADYLGTRLAMAFLGIFALILISWGFYGGETAWVILLWGLAKSIDSVGDIIRGLFQRQERMNLSGTSLMIRGPVALLSMGVLLWLTGKLALAILGVISVWFLVVILYDLRKAYQLLSRQPAIEGTKHPIWPRFSLKVMLSLLWLALPLGVVLFLISIQYCVPRLVLESYHGSIALGYFGPLMYPILMGTMVISAMAQSASPRLANYYVGNLTAYCRLLRKLLLLALGMGILFTAAVVLFGKFILRVLYTAEYAKYHVDFTILSVGGAVGFVVFFCGSGVTAARAFRMQLILTVIACCVSVCLTFLLVPSYGLRGAAVTTTLTFIAALICSFGALVWAINKRKRELCAKTL